MPAAKSASSSEQRLAAKLAKINAVLMDRVERSMDQQGNAFSLFQTAIALDGKVRARTEELTSALRRLARLNEALVIAKDEAERANVSKTRFLAAASHDLLQPLNAARLSISVLSDVRSLEEVPSIVDKVDQALQTLEDLIRTLLDISKLDAGIVQPEATVHPLDDLLSTLETSFCPLTTAKKLKLKVRRCNLLIESDPILLLRVLQNLVSNAVRYTVRGGVLVGVRRRADRCIIHVIDTGCGIAENEREAIFEEFYRGTGAAASGRTGLGLGLSIVKRTTRALGHSLEFTSELNKGSVFRLTVPCLGAAPVKTFTAREWHAGSLTDAVVLIIENDQNVAEALARLIRRWCGHTLLARQPDEIPPLLGKLSRRPDIVIADYHLDRGQTGLAAIAELHRFVGSRVPAVVITADHCETIAADVRAAGCELMHKPIKAAELRALMTHLLTHRTSAPA